MHTFSYNGFNFVEFCRAKTVELAPMVDGGMRCRVKLMLDARAKMEAFATSTLRHRLNTLLFVKGAALRLPEEPGYEYRGAHVVETDPWSDLFETGTTVVTFECADGIAYGDERTTSANDIDVAGTYRTWPTVEMVAEEADSVMVLNLDTERFVNIVHEFSGGELVVIDFERESVTIDGADAACDIGMYSDFFPLAPGKNRLAFAGCEEHTTRYRERWV